MSRRRSTISEILSLVVDAAVEKKAVDPVVLDLADRPSITERFVICHGRSNRQVQAIVERIQEVLQEAGRRPAHIEGLSAGEWVLMDYGDFVVHVFVEERRKFYDLEKLWSDAARMDIRPKPKKGGRSAF